MPLVLLDQLRRKDSYVLMKCFCTSAICLVLLCCGPTACDRSSNDAPATTAATPAAVAPAEATPSPAPAEAAAYAFGEVIKCGTGDNFEKYRGSGWSKIEPESTWTEGTAAVMNFALPKTEGPVTLRMRLAGNVKPPDLTAQPVEVRVNGQKVADWEVGDAADYTATIPAELLQDGGATKIELRIPRAISPKNLGTNQDPRQLGVCCWELDLNQA